MSGAPTLVGAVVNIGSLKDHDRAAFVDLLSSAKGGSIALVLDPSLSGPLGLVLEMSLLKAHGVEKIYHLNAATAPDATTFGALVWLLRPRVSMAKIVAAHLSALPANATAKNIICFVPRRSLLCDRVLQDCSRATRITEFPLDLIPFDDDFLSMELHDDFRESRTDGDRTQLYYVARSIMRLQAAFGIIPTIRGKGVLAKQVCDMLLRMRQESLAKPASSSSSSSDGSDEPTPEIGQNHSPRQGG